MWRGLFLGLIAVALAVNASPRDHRGLLDAEVGGFIVGCWRHRQLLTVILPSSTPEGPGLRTPGSLTATNPGSGTGAAVPTEGGPPQPGSGQPTASARPTPPPPPPPPPPSGPTKGSLLYSAAFNLSSFFEVFHSGSGNMTVNAGSSVDCNVPNTNDKFKAGVNGYPSVPSSFWAEMDVRLKGGAGIAAGWYIEGVDPNKPTRHVHLDFQQQQIYLKDPKYSEESAPRAVPGLSSGGVVHLGAIVQPSIRRYRLLVNGNQVDDFTATDSYGVITPNGYGFDCAADAAGSSGTMEVSGLRLFNLARP